MSTRRAGRLGRRRSRSNRRSNSNPDIIDVESFTDAPTCIDLTEAPDEEFVDLTSVNQHTPIVILSSQSDSSTGPRFRQRQRLGRRRNLDLFGNGDDSDDSLLDDLPPVSFALPDNLHRTPESSSSNTNSIHVNPAGSSGATATNTSVLSPEVKTITCPVCMDTDRQIRRSGRQIVSTTCGHIFCNECVRAAIQTQKKCPNCRKKLNMKQFHPIFI